MARITNGFTVKNWKDLRPIEDAYCFSEDGSVIAVADGITRDPIGMPILPRKSNILGMMRFFWNYPNPSPTSEVARLFCHEFIRSKSIQKCNEAIQTYGESYKRNSYLIDFDYLENDFPACVAAGAVIDKDTVRYDFIADCGVAVFDGKGNIKFKTPNEGPNSKGSINEDVRKKFDSDFNHPEGRRIIRSQYRNNPSEPLAYGALTGEQKAMHYVRTGQIELPCSHILIAYTDGLEKAVMLGEFADKIKQRDFSALRKLCKRKVRTEGTLVYSAGK